MSTILIVNSSPRKNSNTRALAARAAAAAAEKGHEVETVEIGREKINPCIGCETCHTRTPGKCVFDDAMTDFYTKIAKADVIVFSGPIYYFAVSAQTKVFLDRTYAIGPEAFAGKRVGAIFAYGDDDPVKSGCVNAIRMFQDICAYTGATWAGALYGTAMEEGEVADNPGLLALAGEYGAALG